MQCLFRKILNLVVATCVESPMRVVVPILLSDNMFDQKWLDESLEMIHQGSYILKTVY